MKFKSILLDKTSATPIYKQIGDSLANLIKNGDLKPNTKLPPIRTMAESLGVNNVTIVSAYKYLETKKIVYSQVGSGTFVSPIPLESIPSPIMDNDKLFNSFQKHDIKNSINFTTTSLPEDLFPVDEFKSAFDEVLDREKGNAFGYTNSRGYEPLCVSLCSYLEGYGIKSNPDSIQIISGAQQGIDIVSKAMLDYGDTIFTENPTFYGAAGAFISRGTQIVDIPLLADGMDMDALENLIKLYHPKFIYTMVYFQTPTGISYSMAKKRHLLDLAEKYDTYIIEDDNLYDFNYSKKPIIPLKALDYKNRVIYIKSFSKILMPGLRLGFMVLPKKIMHSVMAAKYTTDIATSGFIQKAFDIYLNKNNWERHIEIMRNYCKSKYKIAIKAADRYLSDCSEYIKPQGGISLWLKINHDIDMDLLCNQLLEKNVIVSPGNQFLLTNDTSKFIRICFCNVSDDKIEVGIKRIGETIKSLS